MSSSELDGERARAVDRAWAREVERIARLLLQGRWSPKHPEGLSEGKPRQSPSLWGSTRAELEEAARERWPGFAARDLVTAALRLQEQERNGVRRVDREEWMAEKRQSLQSWLREWLPRNPEARVADAWRAYQLAEGVRTVTLTGFEPGFYTARKALGLPPLRTTPRPSSPPLEPPRPAAEVVDVPASLDPPRTLTPPASPGLREVVIAGQGGRFQATPNRNGTWSVFFEAPAVAENEMDQLAALAWFTLLGVKPATL